jgi:hypothetical protein
MFFGEDRDEREETAPGKRRDGISGRRVVFTCGGVVAEGVAAGVNARGDIVVEVGDKHYIFSPNDDSISIAED